MTFSLVRRRSVRFRKGYGALLPGVGRRLTDLASLNMSTIAPEISLLQWNRRILRLYDSYSVQEMAVCKATPDCSLRALRLDFSFRNVDPFADHYVSPCYLIETPGHLYLS